MRTERVWRRRMKKGKMREKEEEGYRKGRNRGRVMEKKKVQKVKRKGVRGVVEEKKCSVEGERREKKTKDKGVK
jgi:hypothetical protein